MNHSNTSPPLCFELPEASDSTLRLLDRLQTRARSFDKKAKSEACATCENQRMVSCGTLSDGRPRWIACRKCGAEGSVSAAPDGFADPVLALLADRFRWQLTLFLEWRVKPEPLVYAVLCGNVLDAVEIAVSSGVPASSVAMISYWCTAHAPMGCVGSKNNTDNWLEA